MHRQIHDQIAAAIRSGAVAPGTRLPSSRIMARLLGVSRNTMLTAYDELAAGQLIEGKRGSGMRVTAGPSAPALDWRGILRNARYPSRLAIVSDPDGNPIAMSF